MADGGLAHWLAETEPPVADSTIATILGDAARHAPGTLALVEAGGAGRRWTYASLRDAAADLAGALAARFEVGARLAVCAPSVPEALLLTYAAAMAGLVLVPVN